MIFNVVWTLLASGAPPINAQEVNTTDTLPFLRGAFVSQWFAALFAPLGQSANEVLETVLLLLALAVLLGFTVFVTYSKHLHILFSLPNVAHARRPRALGALLPVYSGGKPVDFEDPGEDDLMGVGKVEDFTWKGLLDFGTCTECGRCQSQCPAWNTDKPLSPKLLIMTLRDHALAKAPYLLAPARGTAGEPDGIPEAARAEAQRPLVGPQGDERQRSTSTASAAGASCRSTCSGRAPRAAPASSSAPSTSSTSTTSSTCAATRCSWSRRSPRRPASC